MIVRPANIEDMDDVYMMGFGAWGEGQSKTEYLAACRASQKYKLGEWHCLTVGSAVVSSLVTYKNCLGLENRYGGIGSVATHPHYRENGYAGRLIQNRIEHYCKSQYLGLLLFSDIEPTYYEKFGFNIVETGEESTLMYLGLNGGSLPKHPEYF